jgi:hypothetical protein
MTRLGAFLRRARFDELPQIINVFRGEMSLIGPRPDDLPHARFFLKDIPGTGSAMPSGPAFRASRRSSLAMSTAATAPAARPRSTCITSAMPGPGSTRGSSGARSGPWPTSRDNDTVPKRGLALRDRARAIRGQPCRPKRRTTSSHDQTPTQQEADGAAPPPFNVVVVAQAGRLQYEAALFCASFRAAMPDFPGRLFVAEPQPGPDAGAAIRASPTRPCAAS